MSDILYENYITNDDSYRGIQGDEWRAQTFTPLISHRITSVKLKIFKNQIFFDNVFFLKSSIHLFTNGILIYLTIHS